MGNQIQPPAVNPNPLSFALAPGSRVTLQEQISNPDGSPLLWRADTAGTSWLSIDKNTGVLQPGQNDVVNVTVDASSLAGGGYEATLTFTSEGDTSSADVQVLVTADVSTGLASASSVQPLEVGLSFGTLFTNSSRSLPHLISNPNNQVVQWAVDTGGTDWLTVNRSSGILQPYEQQTIFVTARTAALEVGDYAATLTLTLQGASTSAASLPITVDMHVGNVPYWDSGPHILVSANDGSPSELYDYTLSFIPSANTAQLQIQNLQTGNVSWTSNTGVSWLSLALVDSNAHVIPVGGTIAGGAVTTLTVTANGTDLASGVYSTTLLLSFAFSPNPSSREPTVVPIPVKFTID